MKLFSKISLKIIAPVMVVLFSLSSCTKGDEPVPSVGIENVSESAIVIDNTSINLHTARTSKEVVGGDDNEDDDDKDIRVIIN